MTKRDEQDMLAFEHSILRRIFDGVQAKAINSMDIQMVSVGNRGLEKPIARGHGCRAP